MKQIENTKYYYEGGRIFREVNIAMRSGVPSCLLTTREGTRKWYSIRDIEIALGINVQNEQTKNNIVQSEQPKPLTEEQQIDISNF